MSTFLDRLVQKAQGTIPSRITPRVRTGFERDTPPPAASPELSAVSAPSPVYASNPAQKAEAPAPARIVELVTPTDLRPSIGTRQNANRTETDATASDVGTPPHQPQPETQWVATERSETALLVPFWRRSLQEAHGLASPQPAPEALRPTRSSEFPSPRPSPPATRAQPGLATASNNPAQEPRAVVAPPSIHITIGRVDVRASLAPERTQSRTNAPEGPARPKLSLDAYLSERGGVRT